MSKVSPLHVDVCAALMHDADIHCTDLVCKYMGIMCACTVVICERTGRCGRARRQCGRARADLCAHARCRCVCASVKWGSANRRRPNNIYHYKPAGHIFVRINVGASTVFSLLSVAIPLSGIHDTLASCLHNQFCVSLFYSIIAFLRYFFSFRRLHPSPKAVPERMPPTVSSSRILLAPADGHYFCAAVLPQ